MTRRPYPPSRSACWPATSARTWDFGDGRARGQRHRRRRRLGVVADRPRRRRGPDRRPGPTPGGARMVNDSTHARRLHRRRLPRRRRPTSAAIGCLTITKVAVDPQMSNNCYLLRCTRDRRAGARRRRRRRAAAARADRRPVADRRGHHPPALGPPPGARRGRRRHRRDGRRRRGRRRRDHRADRRRGDPARRRRRPDRRRHLRPRRSSTSPGTRPGSICLYSTTEDGGHLFTGDSLFPGGVGNTFGDADALPASSSTTWRPSSSARCPTSTWFYPGHGGDSTLGAERPHLAEWRERGW